MVYSDWLVFRVACGASARGCTAYWLLAEKSYSVRGEPSDQTFQLIIIMYTVILALNLLSAFKSHSDKVLYLV